MAGEFRITAVLAGDSSSMERSFSSVGSSAQKMAGDFDKAEAKSKSFGGAMDRAGEAAGNSESKFMGTADLLDGLGGAFGLPTEKATGLFRAFGDLSGGFEVLQPMIGSLGTMFTTLGTTLMTPPVGIILLIGALAAALVVAYQKSETFRDIVNSAFGTVKSVAETVFGTIRSTIEGVFNWAKDHWPLLLGILTGPFGLAVGLIIQNFGTIVSAFKGAWNAVARFISGMDFTIRVPHIPGTSIGGSYTIGLPDLPTFHTGGIVPGTPGAEVPIMAMAGETVTPAGAGGGTTVIQLVLDGRVLTEVVHNGLLAKQRRTPLGLAT